MSATIFSRERIVMVMAPLAAFILQVSKGAAMSIQWEEFRAAFEAWKAKRDTCDRWMQLIAAGEPYDRDQLRHDFEELDAVHRIVMERSRLFTG